MRCDSGMYRLVDDDPANEFVQVQPLIPPGTTLVYEVPRDAVRPGKSPLKMMSRAERLEQQQLEHVLRISVSETASSRKVKKRPADNDSPEFLQSARAGMNVAAANSVHREMMRDSSMTGLSIWFC